MSASTVRGVEVQQEDTRSRRQLVTDFMKTLFGLLNELKALMPNSPVDRIINVIKVGKRIDHEIVITYMGPYLFEHRDLIKNRDVEGFTRENLEDKMSKYTKDDSRKYKQIATDLFDIIHQKRKTMEVEEMEKYFKYIDSLLDTYLLFCVRCRYEAKS